MFFIQKQLWLAWRKLRFLRLPPERRVRLEVSIDGRHLTFLLTALGDAGYGVQVVGSPAVFRELMSLRKSVSIPFLIGGKDSECGISISDRPSTLDSGRSSIFVLDYDFFSGLNMGGFSHGGTANTEVGAELGKNESGENFNHGLHEYTRMEGGVGLRLASHAGGAFSNSSTSELARDCENTSPTHFASGPALAHCARGLGSDGGNQLADSVVFLEGQSQAGLQMDNQKHQTIREANDPSTSEENSSSATIREIRGPNSSKLAIGHSLHATASEVPLLDSGPSALDSSSQALRMPYFMHPSVYHKGLHKSRERGAWSVESGVLDNRQSTLDSVAKRRRRFRIGFFGTHDREFYSKYYHFPGMNRYEILEVFLQKFSDRITRLSGTPRNWESCEIAVSIDQKGGDRKGKAFLSQEHYLEALRECDFVLSPPGWCMPVSHNLVEALFCGAIPITNAGAFMAEPLTDELNCLDFRDEVEFVSAVQRALVMDAGEVEKLRLAVWDYNNRYLDPKAFAEEVTRSGCGRLLVNSEENSMRLLFPEMVFPWDVQN